MFKKKEILGISFPTTPENVGFEVGAQLMRGGEETGDYVENITVSKNGVTITSKNGSKSLFKVREYIIHYKK